jgi:C4-dicarboxylate-binding protein DctP
MFLAVLSLAMVPSRGFAQTPQILRISNQLPTTAALTRGLDLWKSRVEAATSGKVRVEIYNNSQLYTDNEVFPAVQSGSVEMGLVVSAQFTAYDPVFAIFDLPGLFSSYDQVTAALHGRVGAVLAAHLDRLGVHPLYWPQQGFSTIATTRRVLNTPADFKHLKLRAHSTQLARMFQLLGAAPTVIAASEVSTAISRGTVDGFSTSLSSYWSRKWYENAPHINASPFGVIGTVVIINKPLWDGLAPDVKAALMAASGEAETFSTQTVIGEERQLLKDLAAKGVQATYFDAAATQQLATLTQPMFDAYAASAGADGRSLLSSVREPNN